MHFNQSCMIYYCSVHRLCGLSNLGQAGDTTTLTKYGGANSHSDDNRPCKSRMHITRSNSFMR